MENDVIDLQHTTGLTITHFNGKPKARLTFRSSRAGSCKIFISNKCKEATLEFHLGWWQNGQVEYSELLKCPAGKRTIKIVPGSQRVYLRHRFV